MKYKRKMQHKRDIRGIITPHCRINSKNSKKAQVTVFIIIGIVALISIGAVLYLNSATQKAKVQKGTSETETAPYDVSPIRDYFEACIQKIGIEAVKKIGEHGGYISLTDPDYAGNFNIDIKNPTESDAVALGNNTGVSYPYWFYMKSKNTCTNCFFTKNNRPSIEMMEDQIKLYTERNIDSCLGDFKPLSDIGIRINRISAPGIDAKITSEDVVIEMVYPVESVKKGTVAKLSKFSSIIDIPLKKYYDYAAQLADSLYKDQSIEKNIISIISGYTGIDSLKLPPIYATDEELTTSIWSKTLVKLDIQDILLQYVSMMKINSTKNGFKYASPDDIEQAFFNNFLINANISDVSSSDKLVNLLYLNWPIYLEITPNLGDLLQPAIHRQKSYGPFPSTQTNTYMFYYDISFPVLIEIRNPDDNRGKGYTFNVAYEANFRDNIDMMQWFAGNGTMGSFPPGAVELAFKDEAVPGIAISDSLGVLAPVMVNKSLFCNPKQAVSRVIAKVRSSDGTPLEGVNVIYGCGTYDECVLAKTDSAGNVNTASPPCVGGYLRLEKDGYLSETQILDLLPGNTLAVDEVLEPYFELNVTVKKLKIIKPIRCRNSCVGDKSFPPGADKSDCQDNCEYSGEQTLSTSPEPLKKEEDTVVILLNRIPDNKFDDSVIETYFFSKRNISAQLTSLKIPPGKYTVMGTYIYEPGFVIPKHCKHICEGYSPSRGCMLANEKVPDEPKNVTPALMGGVIFNQNTTLLDFSYKDMAGKKNVEFYIVQVPTPLCIDDMEEMGNTELYTDIFKKRLLPKFS